VTLMANLWASEGGMRGARCGAYDAVDMWAAAGIVCDKTVRTRGTRAGHQTVWRSVANNQTHIINARTVRLLSLPDAMHAINAAAQRRHPSSAIAAAFCENHANAARRIFPLPPHSRA